ncbi:MAG: uL14 family ribosomal protein [Candidatus Aenigmarchaeota archaeon]|nr:uL14 family ribosomal protein [Candidatus Aenigmarchaeota archaeon]
MKALASKITRGLTTESVLVCADNSGAKEVKIINFKHYQCRKRRNPSGGVGDIVTCAVTKGEFKLRHKVHYGIIVRQKKEFRRNTGVRVAFEDNAIILTDSKLNPLGTEIKGPIAREVVERYLPVGKLASIVV